MNLKNYYWYYQKAVPANVCDDIIKYGLQTKNKWLSQEDLEIRNWIEIKSKI